MKTLSLVLLFSVSLFAHKLNIFTTFEDGRLFVSSYFANGNGCQNCKVSLKDKDENVLQTLTTNVDGEVIFENILNGTHVIVDAGSGHIAKENLELFAANLNDEKKVVSDNLLIEELKNENLELKLKVKSLEEKLQFLDIFKTIFALVVIVLIFLFLKKVKK